MKKIPLIGFADPDERVGALTMQILIIKVFSREHSLLDEYTWYFISLVYVIIISLDKLVRSTINILFLMTQKGILSQ